MKKLFSLLLIFALMLLLISCNNTTNTSMVSCNISSGNESHRPNSKKEYYLNLLDEMCKNDYKYEETDSNKEKVEKNSVRLKKWISILKEIYGVLKTDLPADAMDKLEKEEIKWIKTSKEKAKKASKKYKDDDIRDVVYLDNLIDSIKDRCYELVKTYMNN